jgi:hypothetical protein
MAIYTERVTRDAVIRGGDGSTYSGPYPVNLRVLPARAAQPRVFVVQRRAVHMAEWHFDPNPDTASYIAGLAVQPVIGIPWSPENADLFAALGAGATLTLQMNTGAALAYTFAARGAVGRSDTRLFRQVGPGLALVLIGERDALGAPTARRTVISAAYAPQQELARDGVLNDGLVALTPAPTATPTRVPSPSQQLEVQVIGVYTGPGRAVTQVRLYNPQASVVRVTPDMLWLASGYAPNPSGPRLPAEGMAPFDLLPGQAADVTVHWPWAGEPFASLGVGGYQFAVRWE